MKKTLLNFALLFLLGTNLQAQSSVQVGANAPDFTVTDIHGQTHTLSDYAGKWVFVDFFFTTCGPCQSTAPKMNEFYKKYGCNGYDIIVIAIETTVGDAETAAYEASYGGDQNYPVPSASGTEGGGQAAAALYNPSAFPTIVLIGPDGKMKNNDVWPINDITSLESAITNEGGSDALVVNECSAASSASISSNSNEVIISEVYPNPSEGNFTMILNSNYNTEMTIEVLDLVGKVVYSTNNSTIIGENKLDVNLNGLNAGQYILKATDDSNNIIIKQIQIK
jgi:thiol-disulfide isomerase/thioredoxin